MSFTIKKFSAEWCGPCKMLHPIFNEVSEMAEFKDVAKFEEIDVEDNSDEAVKFGVRSIPCIVILNDETDEVVNKIVGSVDKTTLINKLKESLNIE